MFCYSIQYYLLYTVVGGNPAVVIKKRFTNKVIEQLLSMKWWNWEEEKVKEVMPFICSPKIDGLWNYWLENKKDL